MPDCAFRAKIPRDLRQYLGNWMAESTADVYTREKRNVVCFIWEQVTSCMDKLDTKGYRAAKIDPQDVRAGPPPRPNLLRCLGPDMESPQRGGKVATSPSNLLDSPASSWEVKLIPADEVPPPLHPLSPVSAAQTRGQKRKLHLLNQDLRGLCWQPTMDKIEALNAIDYQQDTDSFILCSQVLPPVLPAVRVRCGRRST